ncbi:MAG: hypothetical protein EOM80_08830, partial [Erysipelotrichia bacterium]|nr:hypothetical protein [Erysipelotrichia bacterium]
MTHANLLCTLIQGAWMGACLKEAMHFRRSANNPLRTVQHNTLREILSKAQHTEYGKKNGFAGIRSIDDFRSRVPVNDYDDLQPWINKIADGNQQILTDDPVIMFEETSGTTGGTRLIPYTSGLQRSFNRALHPWLLDLHLHIGNLWGGPAYWVVTPKTGTLKKTAGGVPIGFAADSDYFGKWAKPLIKAITVVPEEAALIGNLEAWRYLTVLHLVRNDNLRLISLWNPTFFTALIKSIGEWSESLAADLANGNGAKAMPERAYLLKKAVKALDAKQYSEFARILWPRMALISTWTEAEAASGAEQLHSFFPEARFQTKGLLATEGAVTLPMFGATAPVLAARSSFFEFEEGEEGCGKIKLADELVPGGKYRVIMTTFGGLYRYRLHDVVEMRGWWRNLPALIFCGKEPMVSDLCGEKLNAAHIKKIIEQIHVRAAFLAPEKPQNGMLPYYVLFISDPDNIVHTPDIVARLEMGLSENIHYRWSRE